MTSSNGNIFHVTGPLLGHRWIPLTKSSDVEFRCFFDMCRNKQLSNKDEVDVHSKHVSYTQMKQKINKMCM